MMVVAAGGAYLISGAPLGTVALVAIGLSVGAIAFLRTEFAISLIIVAMLLSPELALGPSQAAQRDKGVTLRFDDFLLVIVGITWFIKSALRKELNLLAPTRLNKPMGAYLLICMYSTLIGVQAGRVDPAEGTLFVVKYIEYFFLFWMVINTTHTQKQIYRYLVILLAVASVVSLMAIAQIPTGQRVTAPFQGEHGEPNTLATYLMLMILVALGMALTTPRYRALLIGLVAVMVVPFLFTLSRSSYLAIVPALFVLLLMTRRYLLLGMAAGILLLGLAMPELLLPRAVLDRVSSTFQGPNTTEVLGVQGRFDPSTEARIFGATVALDAFMEHPVVGWGVTGWRFIDSQFLKTLIETGIIGFACFLLLVYAIFRETWGAAQTLRRRNATLYGVACGVFASNAGFLVSSIGTNVFIIVRIMEPFWLLCAILIVASQLESQETAAVIAPRAVPVFS